MHGHFNLPPFGIIEKILTKIKGKKGVCNHHLFGNGENPTCDTLKCQYGNEIGHPQSRTEISKQEESKAMQLSKTNHQTQQTIASQIFKNIVLK